MEAKERKKLIWVLGSTAAVLLVSWLIYAVASGDAGNGKFDQSGDFLRKRQNTARRAR